MLEVPNNRDSKKFGVCDVCGRNHGGIWRGDGVNELPCHPGGKPAQMARQQAIVNGLIKYDGMTMEQIRGLPWYDTRLEPERDMDTSLEPLDVRHGGTPSVTPSVTPDVTLVTLVTLDNVTAVIDKVGKKRAAARERQRRRRAKDKPVG